MSRIILTKHDNGDDHIVVGYDRPLQTFYWQEFAREPRLFWSEGDAKWKVDTYATENRIRVYDTKVEAQDHQYDDWEEMIGFAGYDMGELPRINDMIENAMQNNPRVAEVLADHLDHGSLEKLLNEHKQLPYPASNAVVDLSKRDI